MMHPSLKDMALQNMVMKKVRLFWNIGLIPNTCFISLPN